MANSTMTRRKLFQSILSLNPIPKDGTDPLFKKYSRKNYSLRRKLYYSNPTNKTTATSVVPITTGLAPYAGVWTTSEVLHLLRRTGYGFRKSDADLIGSMTMDAAVNMILNIDNTVPAPPVNWYQNISPDENGIAYGADVSADAFSGAVSNGVVFGQTTNSYRSDGLMHWSCGQALNQDITIREKMTWFWYHFIPVDFFSIYKSVFQYTNSNSARICYQYTKMFRDNAGGNFKSLIREMATQPAMMFYLNGHANTNTAPDENFGREVMELFTLGKDPLSQYTQDDVVAAAKVLTGWRVMNLNTNNTTTAFDSTKHDTSDKQFSSFFNNTVIANAGASEIDTFFDMIFSKEQVVSEYICRRLYRYFIYYDIDATIEANIITPLAQTFVANNWNILPVLNQLLKSEHFFDIGNRGVYIKSPFDLIVGTMRMFNISTTVSDPTNYEAQDGIWKKLNDVIANPMAQSFGFVPNVAGWPPFYQNPSFHEYWINSDTVQLRFFFLNKLMTNAGYSITTNGLTTNLAINEIAWVQQFGDAICSDPDLLVEECISYLLPLDLSQSVKDTLKTQNLLTGQTNNSYWTTAWNNYTADPTNSMNTNIVSNRLTSLLSTILQFAEFQLM